MRAMPDMGLTDALMAVAVVLVSLWLGRGASRGARWTLWLSALVISAGMFLPMTLLRGLVVPEWLAWLESASAYGPWKLADLVHLLAFSWLAVVLWTLRPDLRGPWLAVALVVLAIASEALQILTVERSPRVGDVLINLVGAAAGWLLAVTASAIWNKVRQRAPADAGPAGE